MCSETISRNLFPFFDSAQTDIYLSFLYTIQSMNPDNFSISFFFWFCFTAFIYSFIHLFIRYFSSLFLLFGVHWVYTWLEILFAFIVCLVVYLNESWIYFVVFFVVFVYFLFFIFKKKMCFVFGWRLGLGSRKRKRKRKGCI